jgi:hypothetical protein
MDIKYEPYKRITIRNYMYYASVDDFAASLTLSFSPETGGRVGHLLWAHGILFRHAPYTPTERVSNEYLEGHLPLDNVEFTTNESFTREIRYGHFIITVMDVSNNFVLSTLAKWIADNLIKKDKSTTKKKLKIRH